MSSMPMTNQHSPAAVSRAWRPAASVDLPALDVPLSTTTRPAVTAAPYRPVEHAERGPQPARRSRAGLLRLARRPGTSAARTAIAIDRRADEGELTHRHDRLGLHPEPVGVEEPRDPAGGHAHRDADRRDHRAQRDRTDRHRPSQLASTEAEHTVERELRAASRATRSITRNAITKSASTAAMIPSAFGTVATPSSRTPVSGPRRGESASRITRPSSITPRCWSSRFIGGGIDPGSEVGQDDLGTQVVHVWDAEVGDELSETLEGHGRTDVELVRVQRQDGGAHHADGHRPGQAASRSLVGGDLEVVADVEAQLIEEPRVEDDLAGPLRAATADDRRADLRGALPERQHPGREPIRPQPEELVVGGPERPGGGLFDVRVLTQRGREVVATEPHGVPVPAEQAWTSGRGGSGRRRT